MYQYPIENKSALTDTDSTIRSKDQVIIDQLTVTATTPKKKRATERNDRPLWRIVEYRDSRT